MPRLSVDGLWFCVRPLCELQLFTALDANDTRHHPHWELWYSHGDLSTPLHFTFFSKGRITALKEVKNKDWNQKIMNFSPLKHIHILRSHRDHRKGRDFGTFECCKQRSINNVSWFIDFDLCGAWQVRYCWLNSRCDRICTTLYRCVSGTGRLFIIDGYGIQEALLNCLMSSIKTSRGNDRWTSTLYTLIGHSLAQK